MSNNDPAKNAYTTRERTPYKVGICMEWAGGTQVVRDFYDAIRLVCDEYTARGELDRPVELVIREVMGPMRGTNPIVIDTWRELAEKEKCIAIIGPEVTEANLALVDVVNEVKVPTISFCATFDWAGPYCYALQNGGFPDEANVIAGLLALRGHRRIGVFHEEGIIGTEYFEAFRHAARRHGLKIVSDHIVGLFNTLEPVDPQVAAVRQAGVDAVVVFSAYGALPPVAAALRRAEAETGWSPPKFMNTTWVLVTAFGGAGDYDQATLLRDLEGWTGLDQIHEGNPTFQGMLDKFQARYGRRPFHVYTALGFDHGMVIADTLSRAKPPSPKGFKEALERLRMRPACVGGPDTIISFGAFDNRGYKGRYITVRDIRNGKEALVDVPLQDLLPAAPVKSGGEAVADASSAAMSGAGSRYVLTGDRTPHRIGVLQDFCLWAPEALPDWYKAMQLAFEEAYDSGLVDRPIEMVIREVEGPPEGPYSVIVDTYRELVHKEKVLAVVGPLITDSARCVRDVVEQEKVPAISYVATFDFAGEYCFQAPNGTFADETFLIANHLVNRRGAKSVGVIREDNPIGDEYFNYFRQHARRLGLAVASDQIVSPRCTREQMREAVREIRRSGAQSVAHMGYGMAFYEAMAVMKEMEAEGWKVPKISITIWVVFSGMHEEYGSPKLMNMPAPPDWLEGWVGIDQPHEGNKIFQAYLDRYVKRFGGPRPFNCYPALMYDIGRVLAEAISRARPVTPKGMKRALEQVRMLPATMGAPGTVLSFGPYDHRGYKHPDYLVLRTLQNGREGLVDDLLK
ncbi:MAG: ABC transporter substrate-binding protein [Gammaproteobacteria bacterium]